MQVVDALPLTVGARRDATTCRPQHGCSTRIATRRPCSQPCSGRHVVASLHRGAAAPRPGVLHRRPARPVRRGGVALLAGRRRPQARRRGRDDDRGRAGADHNEPCRATSWRRRATCSRAGSCGARGPCSIVGVRPAQRWSSRAVRARSPRCSPRWTRSRATTSRASPRTLLAPDKLRLAAIGPFERREALRGARSPDRPRATAWRGPRGTARSLDPA